MTKVTETPLNRAGTALLHAARLQAEIASDPNTPGLNNAGYTALLAEARRQLAQADPAADSHKFLATKTALEALEAVERGDDTLGGTQIFKSLVESVHGGKRELDFGGRRMQGPKPSADQAYLRAAAVGLWIAFPNSRTQLVSDARTLIGVGTEKALQKLVENFHERHDVDLSKSKTPLSVHMPLIKQLIEDHGYRSLNHFV